MKSRLVAAAGLCAAVLLGTTGCGLTASIATEIPYSPSDGVTVPYSGPLEVRNALIVVDEDGEIGNFIAAIVNSTDTSQKLTVQVGEGSGRITETVTVTPNGVVSLGTQGQPPLTLDGIDAMPGSTVEMFFQSGDASGATIAVPVLNGELGYLSTLVPTPSPSRSLASPTPTVPASPSPTPSSTATTP